MTNLRNLLAVSKTFNLPLRITEAATLSYGGVQVGLQHRPAHCSPRRSPRPHLNQLRPGIWQLGVDSCVAGRTQPLTLAALPSPAPAITPQGVSDIAGAAIWVLDTAMEVCFNGADGIIFHQVRTAGRRALGRSGRLWGCKPAALPAAGQQQSTTPKRRRGRRRWPLEGTPAAALSPPPFAAAFSPPTMQRRPARTWRRRLHATPTTTPSTGCPTAACGCACLTTACSSCSRRSRAAPTCWTAARPASAPRLCSRAAPRTTCACSW
jgi:hypothetical protein